MSKDDGQLRFHGEVTPLMQLLLQRRSCRKYAEGSAAAEQIEALLDRARSFQDRCGFRAPRLLVVSGAELARAVSAAMRGLMVTVNPWLPSTAARHLLLCGAVWAEGAEPAAIEHALAEAAMTMQVALLAATEVGLGSCWLAGIDHDAVERALGLPDGAKLVAISPLGLPPAKKGLWDAALFHITSKRRKPLETLWLKEQWTP
jgi:nitroreductase